MKPIDNLILNREKYLETRSVNSIVSSLGGLSLQWQDRNYSFRKKAVKRLVEKSFFSEAMANALLDALFEEQTQAKLLKLLKAEFQDPRVLDEFRRETLTGKWQRARGPRLITHIFSGNVPNPSILSFVLGMLVKSANIGKTSSKDEGFLDIYLESLREADPKLARTNLLLEPTDKQSLFSAIRASGLVVAYGRDASLGEIRSHVHAATPFIGYGHRVSFGIYTKEALNKKNIAAFAEGSARDIWMTDQRGCLSPMEIFVETGGEVSPEEFSEKLKIALEHAFAMRAWRLPLGLGAVHTVGFAGKKMVSVRPVKNLKEALKVLKPFHRYLQAVSLEAGPDRSKKMRITETLSRLGVNRICRAGQMQRPPVTWHHDGKWNLASCVNWSDLEI